MSILGTVFFTLVSIVGALLIAMGATEEKLAGGMVVGAILLIIGIVGIVRTSKARKRKKERIEEIGSDAYKEERKGEKKAAKERAASNREIDYVIIAGQESKTKTGSAVARGVVGGAMLGPVGLLAAAGAKKSTDISLIIRYKSGRTETKTVKFNSKEFKQYAKYIR